MRHRLPDTPNAPLPETGGGLPETRLEAWEGEGGSTRPSAGGAARPVQPDAKARERVAVAEPEALAERTES